MAVRHGHWTPIWRQIDVFGNKCLPSIIGYRWNDFVSNQRLLRETESRPITSTVCNINSGYMGMWHVTQKMILLLWLFLKGITRSGGGQVRGWGKSMLPAGGYLVWEGGLHGDLHGVIGRAGIRGLARRRTSRCMPPKGLIDWLCFPNLRKFLVLLLYLSWFSFLFWYSIIYILLLL